MNQQARRPQENDELKISFNTPGSKADRELTLDYVLNRRATTVTAGLKSPWKKADFTGELVMDIRIPRFNSLRMNPSDPFTPIHILAFASASLGASRPLIINSLFFIYWSSTFHCNIKHNIFFAF